MNRRFGDLQKRHDQTLRAYGSLKETFITNHKHGINLNADLVEAHGKIDKLQEKVKADFGAIETVKLALKNKIEEYGFIKAQFDELKSAKIAKKKESYREKILDEQKTWFGVDLSEVE